MGKIGIILTIVMITTILVVGGLIFFNREIKIERRDYYEAETNGSGIGAIAQCPEGKEVIRGECISYDTSFELVDEQRTKTRDELNYYNAYLCTFSSNKLGRFEYTAIAYCK